MSAPLLFSAFVLNCTSHIMHGVWRQPGTRNVEFNELEFWGDLAVELERGLFDLIMFLTLRVFTRNFAVPTVNLSKAECRSRAMTRP